MTDTKLCDVSERIRIRKAQAKALRELMACETAISGLIGEGEGQGGWNDINERIDVAMRVLDDATKRRKRP